MDIATLAKQLKQKIQDDRLSFADMAQLVPPIAQFVDRFMGTQTFVLQDTTLIVDIDPATITIKGKSPWQNSVPLLFEFNILYSGEKLSTTITLDFAQQTLADMDWLQLNPLSMTIDGSSRQDMSATLQGSATLFDSTIAIAVDTGDASEQLSLSASISQLNFSSMAEQLLTELSLPTDLPDFSFTDTQFHCTPSAKTFRFAAKSFDDWTLPLGITGLQVDDIGCQLSREIENAEQQTFRLAGSLMGSVEIAGVQFDLSFSFPGEYRFTAVVPKLSLSAILQDLCGSDALMGFPAPSSVLNVTMKNIRIDALPASQSFSVQGTCLFGEIQLVVNNKQGKWQFLCAIRPAANWHFSDIDRSLRTLDGLNFKGSALVLSNASNHTPSTLIELPSGISLKKGLNFIATIDASELQLDDLLGLESLQVSAVIGTKPSDLLIIAGIAGTFKISDNVAMGNMGLRLRPAPDNFAIGVKGEVLARLDHSDLRFVGTMEIRPIERSAAFAATMLGEWREPFGIKGLAVADLAIEIGVGIVPPPAVAAPIVGFAGRIQIGSFTGSAAVKMDTVTPSKSMLAADFNRLYLREVMEVFCDQQVMRAIPAEIRSTVLEVGLEDVAVYVVPQATQIGELSYEAGFAFQGKLSIADFDAQFSFKLDYSKGFAIRAEMDTLNIDNLIIITGSGRQPNPIMAVNLMLGEKAGIEIAARVKLLEISAETAISLSDNGFRFLVQGTLFNLFAASIEASGGNLQQGGDFYLKIAMKNDLMVYLRTQAVAVIKDGTDSAIRDLTHAQNVLSKAQRDVQGLKNEINRVRNIIRQERRQHSSALTGAQRELQTAQNTVNQLKRNINAMRAVIKRERARDTANLRNAQRAVSKAQSSVNNLQHEINSSKRRIKTLENDIAKKKRWLDKSPWYRKVDRGIEYTAYAGAKGVEIAAIYTKIAGIEAAKGTAYLALEAAKQIVRGIERAANLFPIDADPRILALFTAKGAATAGLEVAKQSVIFARNAVNTFPIDADPRILALFTAKETANAALEVAKFALEGVKVSVGGLADVATFITTYGLGGLLDVRAASFEGQLNVIHGGQVAMALKLDIMQQPVALQLRFNFNQPLASAKVLGEDLLRRLT